MARYYFQGFDGKWYVADDHTTSMLEVLQRRMDEAYKRIMDKESRMTKTVCDICGKEMPTAKYADTIEDMNFRISSHGKIWDICNECRVSLNKWMTIRRRRAER